MDNLNGEIKDIFATFRTDLSGIRVKKLLKLVRTVQATIPDLEQSSSRTIQVYENGHSICVSQLEDHWSLQIDAAAIILDVDNVYDANGDALPCKELAPQVIKTILAA